MVHKIAGLLVQIGHNVTVLNGFFPGAKRAEVIDGVQYKRVGFGRFGPRIDQAVYLMLLPLQVVFRKYNVWIENSMSPISVSFLQIFTWKPIILRTSFFDAKEMTLKYGIPFHYLENMSIKTYKNFIASSEVFGDKIAKVNKKANIHLIPNGIDDKYFNVIRQEQKFILFLSRVDFEQKGMDMLLTIAAGTLLKNNIRLVIAGSGSAVEVRRLQDEIKSSPVANKIEYIGKVENEAKIKLLSEAMVLVSTSRHETFSNSVLEAMASGVPTIGFDIDGLSWASGHEMVKVTKYNIKIFQSELEKLLNDNNLRNTYSKNAKDFATKYKWENLTRLYENLLSSLGI